MTFVRGTGVPELVISLVIVISICRVCSTTVMGRARRSRRRSSHGGGGGDEVVMEER